MLKRNINGAQILCRPPTNVWGSHYRKEDDLLIEMLALEANNMYLGFEIRYSELPHQHPSASWGFLKFKTSLPLLVHLADTYIVFPPQRCLHQISFT